MTKSKALEGLAKIVRPINERAADAFNPMATMKCFIEGTNFPLFRRKWKRSTAMTTEDRIRRHIVDSFGQRELRSLKRKDLPQGHTLDVNLNVTRKHRWKTVFMP